MQNKAEILLQIFERPALWVALRGICDHPKHELRVETPYVGVGEAQALEASLLGASAHEPGALAVTDRRSHFVSHGQKWRFLKVFDRRIVRHELTPANQFVAYFVRYSLKTLKGFAYGIAHDEDLGDYFPEFLRIIRRLNAIWDGLSPAFKYTPLTTLPLDNQLLQFDPHYHVILESYLALEGGR
jgi:hypothetical protein